MGRTITTSGGEEKPKEGAMSEHAPLPREAAKTAAPCDFKAQKQLVLDVLLSWDKASIRSDLALLMTLDGAHLAHAQLARALMLRPARKRASCSVCLNLWARGFPLHRHSCKRA